MTHFNGSKWRSRCGVNSNVCLRESGIYGFVTFLMGRSRGVDSESSRSQFTVTHFYWVHMAESLRSQLECLFER